MGTNCAPLLADIFLLYTPTKRNSYSHCSRPVGNGWHLSSTSHIDTSMTYSTDQLIVKFLLSFCYLFAIFLTAFAIYDKNLFVFKWARSLKLANFRNLTSDI